MPSVEWRHNRRQLFLPVAVLPPLTADDPSRLLWTDALLDTGATGTGLRADLVAELQLKPKGRRRVGTANGDIMAAEYLFRIGFPSDLEKTVVPTRLPFVLEQEFPGFELVPTFAYPLLLGMDVLGLLDLSIRRDGTARLEI